MIEGEGRGVESEWTVRVPRRVAVESVTKNRVAECGKMNPELVRAACERFEIHEADGVVERA
jgi:hypothetical protein